MADRRISDLNPAPSTLDDSNTLFVVEQARTAYRLDGHSFIAALTVILDGHGGIASIAKTGTSGNTDTYTITMADQTTTTFTVTNGKGISSITQYWAVSTSGTTVPGSWSTTRQSMTVTNRYLWSYMRFAYNDGTSFDTTKSVVGVYGDTGAQTYVWIKYSSREPIADADLGNNPDKWIGVYVGLSSTAPTSRTAYTWYQYKGEKGDTGDPSSIISQSVTYMESSSGTVVPEGSWSTTIPSVAVGNFLWTRMRLIFNDQSEITAYSVSRNGVDGLGAVSTVNGIGPAGNGNVALTAANIPTSDSTSVQAHITSAESNISTAQGDISTAQGNISSLGNRVTALEANGSVTTARIANGAVTDAKIATSAKAKVLYDAIEVTLANVSSTNRTFTCTGITADHELVQNGFAYLSNPSAAGADLTLTTSANQIVVSGTLSDTTDIVATFCIKGQKVSGA